MDLRGFRLGYAAVLVALLWGVLKQQPKEEFEGVILLFLALAIPAAVFRVILVGHPKKDALKGALGIAGVVGYFFGVAAFDLLFAGHNKCAAMIFAVSCATWLVVVNATSAQNRAE